MTTFARYVGRKILSRFALIVLILASLLIASELMDDADKLLRMHDRDHLVLLRYAALRLPSLAAELASVAALLAALLTVADLLRHRELIASWNMGLSPAMLIAGLLPFGLLLGAGQALLAELVVPWTVRPLVEIGFEDQREGLFTGGTEGPLWLRHGNQLIRMAQSDGDATGAAVSIFLLDPRGLLVERLDARRLVQEGGGWQLEGVVRRGVQPATVERLDHTPWPVGLDPRHLDLLMADARNLPLRDLVRVLATGDTGSRPQALYWTWTIHRVIGPLQPALMMMLAIALARRFDRVGGAAWLLVGGGAIGFGYFMLDQAAVALGEADILPSWLAAAGSSVALALLVAWLLRPSVRRAPPTPVVQPSAAGSSIAGRRADRRTTRKAPSKSAINLLGRASFRRAPQEVNVRARRVLDPQPSAGEDQG
jgi:lipopolysaccharide export system permease protein